MKKKADVVVVGGGPCGSFSALTAAKLGSEVVVCEEHGEIGFPAHCSGHVSVSGLKRLGLDLPKEVIENEIRGAVFHSPFGKEFVVKSSLPVSVVVNRRLFDKHLANLATDAGVKYCLGSRVKSLLLNSGSVKGILVRSGGMEDALVSNIVIDAEGCRSTLLRKTGIRTLDKSMVVKAVQAEAEKVDEINRDMVEVYFGEKLAPGFFAWVIPTGDASAKVGLATRKGDPRRFLYKFMHDHPVASKKFRRSVITDMSFHPIPLGGAIPKTCFDGLLITGDAASQVKPTTGGGIIFGLLCSKIAGEVASEALKMNNFSEIFLSKYEKRWKKIIGFDLSVMLKIRKMANLLRDNQIDRMIYLSKKLGLETPIMQIMDLDFEGRSMLRVIRHPAAGFLLLYFLFSWFTSSTKSRKRESVLKKSLKQSFGILL